MQEAIKELKRQIENGEHWFIAILRSIALWTDKDRRFFIHGEALDWLEIAKKLCQEINDHVPRDEIEQFLSHGKPPLKITPEEFKELIGPVKYQAYLNYFYGVVVEQALQEAVEQEVRKRRRCLSLPEEAGLREEVFLSLYGATDKELTGKFLRGKNYPKDGLDSWQKKEFTYWLFKYRLRNCPPEKVASDTKKGLQYLRSRGDHPFINHTPG